MIKTWNQYVHCGHPSLTKAASEAINDARGRQRGEGKGKNAIIFHNIFLKIYCISIHFCDQNMELAHTL